MGEFRATLEGGRRDWRAGKLLEKGTGKNEGAGPVLESKGERVVPGERVRVGWIPGFEEKGGLGRAVPWTSQGRKFEMVHMSRKKQTSSQIQDG